MTTPAGTPSFVARKTAIITGAGSGICLCFAKLLLSHGCNVVIADLALRPEAEELVKAYSDSGKSPRAVFIKTDVTSWAALSNMFDVTLREFGDFHILCPGAGVYEEHWSNFWHPPGSAESRDTANGGNYKLLDINLTHPIRATQIAISHWLHPRQVPNSAHPAPSKASKENAKRIVHISSVARYLPTFNAPLYGASKYAIIGFVRSFTPLEASLGIRVNAVAPGVVRTPLWTEHPEKMLYLDSEQDGWVTPDEVAAAMLRCIEDDGFEGGSIVEVGKGYTRLVSVLNDPGPDFDPSKGIRPRNMEKGAQEVMKWLGDDKIWGPHL